VCVCIAPFDLSLKKRGHSLVGSRALLGRLYSWTENVTGGVREGGSPPGE
jgi:hypothetical protein